MTAWDALAIEAVLINATVGAGLISCGLIVLRRRLASNADAERTIDDVCQRVASRPWAGPENQHQDGAGAASADAGTTAPRRVVDLGRTEGKTVGPREPDKPPPWAKSLD